MVGRIGDLVGQYDKLRESKAANPEIHQGLESYLKENAGQAQNPWNPAAPAYSYTIAVTSGLEAEEIKEAARQRSTELGQAVFVIQFPAEIGDPAARPGYLAGAVRTQNPITGSSVFAKAVPLD